MAKAAAKEKKAAAKAAAKAGAPAVVAEAPVEEKKKEEKAKKEEKPKEEKPKEEEKIEMVETPKASFDEGSLKKWDTSLSKNNFLAGQAPTQDDAEAL